MKLSNTLLAIEWRARNRVSHKIQVQYILCLRWRQLVETFGAYKLERLRRFCSLAWFFFEIFSQHWRHFLWFVKCWFNEPTHFLCSNFLCICSPQFRISILIPGIGIDDTFVMLAAWRRTSVKASVPDRMGIMMAEAAVSITITSLTDMISLLIGISSPFPSMQIFCLYSFLAVLFIFCWHITFFAGCMAVSGYWEEENRSLLYYKVLPVSVAMKGNKFISFYW